MSSAFPVFALLLWAAAAVLLIWLPRIWRRGDAPETNEDWLRLRQRELAGEAEAAQLHEEAGTPDLDPLRNMIVLNSLSKRSSAAGLRAGFIVGDAAVIRLYAKLVANSGSLVPTPLLFAAADLYDDDDHVAAIRAHYDHSFLLAEQYLGVTAPQGGFFLWLAVGDDRDFVRRLMQEQAVRAMPGRFMAETVDGQNPGEGYVRLALVHDHARTEASLKRVAQLRGVMQDGGS